MLCEVEVVVLIFGIGEYLLVMIVVSYDMGLGEMQVINCNILVVGIDFQVLLWILGWELLCVGLVLLVVLWFGDDLCVGNCMVQFKVEDCLCDGQGMVWCVGGIGCDVV